MAAPYTVVGESFRAETPQVWSPGPACRGASPPNEACRISIRTAKRIAAAAVPDESSVVQDRVVYSSSSRIYPVEDPRRGRNQQLLRPTAAARRSARDAVRSCPSSELRTATIAPRRLCRRARAHAAAGTRPADCRRTLRRARLFDSGRITLRSLLLNDAALNGLSDILERRRRGRRRLRGVAEVITAATGFNMHRGCLALAERPAELSMERVLADQPVRRRPRTRRRSRQRRIRVSQRRGVRRRCGPAQSWLLRSVLPQGDPDVVGRGAGRAVCGGRAVAGCARPAAGGRDS